MIPLIIELGSRHAIDVGTLRTYWNWTFVAVKYFITLIINEHYITILNSPLSIIVSFYLVLILFILWHWPWLGLCSVASGLNVLFFVNFLYFYIVYIHRFMYLAHWKRIKLKNRIKKKLKLSALITEYPCRIRVPTRKCSRLSYRYFIKQIPRPDCRNMQWLS